MPVWSRTPKGTSFDRSIASYSSHFRQRYAATQLRTTRLHLVQIALHIDVRSCAVYTWKAPSHAHSNVNRPVSHMTPIFKNIFDRTS